MRLGRWIGIVMGILVVAIAVVMLVLLQRQLERLRDARAASDAPASATQGGTRRPAHDAPLPPGAMR
jgi:uncharacterized membrane protein